MELSILMPFIPRRIEQALPFAALVEWSSATRLWTGQGLALDSFATIAAASGAGFRVPSGIGVALMPLTHPFDAAHQGISAAMVTGHPFTLGIGPGPTSFQAALLGEPYARPLRAVREYATIVGALVRDGIVDVHGEYFRCAAHAQPVPAPPVHLGLGVLRAGMARLAGELADVAITWLTPSGYIADVLAPAITSGARGTRITAMVPVARAEPDRNLADVVTASNAPHLTAPHYRDMLRRAGIDYADGDLSAAAAGLDRTGAFLWGSAEEIAQRLREYLDAGVDEVVLNVTGVYARYGPRSAIEDLRAILAEAHVT